MLQPHDINIQKENRLKKALANARALLRGDEKEVPQGVIKSISYLAKNNIWYKLSRNSVVKSCKGMEYKRLHVGRKEISFSDELKTYLAKIKYNDNDERVALIHCRADRNIDFNKIKSLLPDINDINRVGENDIKKIRTSGYGLINPFDLHKDNNGVQVLQVFDLELLNLNNVTNSVITNAGEFTWAIEFRPNELISVLRNNGCIVSDIIEDKQFKKIARPKSIGIIAGNPPESAWLLWRMIERVIKREMGENFVCDVSLPKVIMASIPEMGLSMELADHHEQLWNVLKKNIDNLINQDIEIISIACHTSQFYTNKVREYCIGKGVEYVSIPETLYNWLKLSNIDKAALLGIGYSAQLGEWSGYNELSDIIEVENIPQQMIDRITGLAYDVKHNISRREFQKLERIIKDINSDNIIYLLFELSILAEHFSLSKNFHKHYIIDAAEIYAQALAAKIMGKNYGADI
ncbi:MAG: hypothetical protein GY804_10875 [Alphaproteobacteria bacterium]|nr:hypothetical protein [Alphaproteobacteria bacterium]